MREGISASLATRKIQDADDRVREMEEMSTVGLEISTEDRAKTLKQLNKQRKQT